MQSEITVDTYDQRLAQAVVDGAPDADRAALTLFERHDPRNRTQAINLVVPSGPVSPEMFDRISRAYDVYRHTTAAPRD
jgi:hypothetical protein